MAAISCRSPSTASIGRPPSRAVASSSSTLARMARSLVCASTPARCAAPCSPTHGARSRAARAPGRGATRTSSSWPWSSSRMASRTVWRSAGSRHRTCSRNAHIVVVHGVTALEPGTGAQYAERLRPAAIRRHHAAARRARAAGRRRRGARRRAPSSADTSARAAASSSSVSVVRTRRRLRLQELQEAEVLADVVDDEAQQEAVVERQQLVVLGQLVARRRTSVSSGTAVDLAPVVEAALVASASGWCSGSTSSP